MRAAFLLSLALGLLMHGSAWAQADSRGLVDRLDRLERDLSTLQGQVYRGGGGGGGNTVITSPAAGGAISGDTYSILDQRISALDSQIRDLTGQVEKTGFLASQLQSKLERMQADNDFRFKELEQKVGGAPPAGNPPPQGAPPPAGASGAAAPPPKDWNPTMGAPPGFLGQVSPNDIKRAQQDAAPAAAPPPPAAAKTGIPVLPGKSPQEQYDYAFGLLRNSDDEGASRAFTAFVAQHPQDPLAGNAMYWLGRIPFAQGDYEQAVPLFMDAYRKYPKSAKAAESLLNVGLSYSNLKKKREACIAILRFQSEFPDASDNLKRQAVQEKQKLGC